MNRMRYSQRGMTLIGVLIGAVLVVFFVYAGAKLTPVYLENFGVTSSLKSLANEDNIRGAGPNEIRSFLIRRLDMNNVKNVEPQNITVRIEGNQRIVSIDYEVRTRFYGNLYLLMSFSDQAVLTGN